MQFLGPSPNDKKVIGFLDFIASSLNLSGSKTAGSGKYR